MLKSSIITSDKTDAGLLSPVAPGELLKEEFLVPLNIALLGRPGFRLSVLGRLFWEGVVLRLTLIFVFAATLA